MKFIDLIPAPTGSLLGLLKDIKRGNAAVSYSQQGEDLAIQRYFGDRANGFFVDVGAFQPVKYSNTYLFYKRGWRGINIEPNPEHFDLFRKKRPFDINLNIGISEDASLLSYYKLNAPALNTFEKAHADLWASRPGFRIMETLDVETYQLRTILEKHAGGKHIDFMSVDVEGFDLKVLKSNDWAKFRPELLLVEESISETDVFKKSEIFHFLNKIGYELWSVSGGTVLFKDQQIKQT